MLVSIKSRVHITAVAEVAKAKVMADAKIVHILEAADAQIARVTAEKMDHINLAK